MAFNIKEKLFKSNPDKKIKEDLWEHVYNLYEEGETLKTKTQRYYDYYLGRVDVIKEDPDYRFEESNSNNVIKQIIDTKVTLTLDSQMTTTVMPKTGSFSALPEIKQAQNIADVYNDCLKQVQKINEWDCLKHFSTRWGAISGIGAAETVWNPDKGMNGEDGVVGEVEINQIDPRYIRWDKNAKRPEDATFFTIELDLSPYELKKRYAQNPDGSFNKEMSDKIDDLSHTTKPKEDKKRADQPPVVSYNSDQGGGLAFSGSSKGIQGAGKSVKLIKIYLKDDSTFAPSKEDSSVEEEEKQTFQMLYPNGRCMIISADKKHKVIFEDKSIDYPFGMPVDVFNYSALDTMDGKGEVEDLVSVQDKIVKAYARLRTLVAKYISSVVLDKGYDMELNEGDLVNNFVTFMDNLKGRGKPDILTNNTLSEIQNLINYINLLKADAREIARVNETMISGTKEPGVTSGEQIKALREDPQSSIRAIQRQLRIYLMSISNKALALIDKYYSFQRIIKLTTNLDIDEQAKYAQFDDGSVTLLNEAGETIKEIKKHPDISFEVDIVAGTEIPRSRTENAQLMERIATSGILETMDLDLLEAYLRAIDLPNYREVINITRKKREEVQPQMPPAEKINGLFQHLPIWAQEDWLSKNGFTKPEETQPIKGLPPEQATDIAGGAIQ